MHVCLCTLVLGQVATEGSRYLMLGQEHCIVSNISKIRITTFCVNATQNQTGRQNTLAALQKGSSRQCGKLYQALTHAIQLILSSAAI